MLMRLWIWGLETDIRLCGGKVEALLAGSLESMALVTPLMPAVWDHASVK